MNLSNQKTRFLFATHLIFIAAFAILFFSLTITPANAANEWHIKDDATGGDCTIIGNWNSTDRICTLTQNVFETIQIDHSNITLNGSGYISSGSSSGNGVYVPFLNNVTIKNLNLSGWGVGILSFSSTFGTIENNNISGASYGIYLVGGVGNTLTGNFSSNNLFYGVVLASSNGNNLVSNTTNNNGIIGLFLTSGLSSYSSYGNVFTNNSSKENNHVDVLLGVNVDPVLECSNNFVNTTGSGDRQIGYFNSPVDLTGGVYSELIFCNADDSNVSGVTVNGSDVKFNNSLIALFTDNSNFSNITSSNNVSGMYLGDSSGNTLNGIEVFSNAVAGVSFGNNSSNNSLTDSLIEGNSTGISVGNNSNNLVVSNNVVLNNTGYGFLETDSSTGHLVFNNDFIGNTTQAVVGPSIQAAFNEELPAGGNYWSNFDEPAEGCNNLNNDGFCDAPYIFTGGQDNLPWTKKDGWVVATNIPPALSYSQDAGYIDDGINPDEGNAETAFTFKIIYTDADNNAPVNISLVVGDGTATTTHPLALDASASIELHDSNYANGEQFTATSTFSKKSQYFYHFETSDGKGGTTRTPATGELSFTAWYLVANPYIKNVSFGQDEQGDYISFDWVGVPEQTGSCTRDIVAVWFNRFNPDGTTESMQVPPNPYAGDLTAINNGGGSYSNFGNYAFASGFTKYDFCGTNDPDLSKELPQHIKTYINPKLSPERLSFTGQDFITIQLIRLHLNVVNVFAQLLVSDPQPYYYQVPTNPIPVIPYTNVKFGFDENDLLKISFDWVGPSRDTGLLAGFNGSISYPFYAKFVPDPSKDISMVLEDGHNENFGNVGWLGGPSSVQKGQHYEIPVNELHEWSPINTLRVCNWYYPCPVSRSLTESLLGRSFKPDDYITLAFYSTSPSQPSLTSYVLNDPNKYYFEIRDIDTFIALGDSFSSGFGVPPFEEGTHQDNGFNDCQRSENAYPQVVAEEVGLGLSFHACQGATTKHMYERRVDGGNDWGEAPQLENLDPETELVTLTIGGNDVGFADVLKECILGFELLPFNTCFSDTKVTDPVQEGLARLDGGSGPSDIKPYDVIFKDIRRLAPIAKGIAIGYPHLFTASGDDRTFLPGGRCEGVKKADQRWMVEKIDELNDIIERNALRNGLLFALPVFDDHELCSTGEEWIFDALSDGAFHPTINGHRAIVQAVTDELLNDAQKTKILIEPFQTFAYAFSVGSGKALLSFTSEWPGSDIVTSLQSPSGIIYTRNSGNALYHDNGATWEHYEITQPETGTWTATLYGADVAPGGEDAVLSVYLEDPPNQPPVGNISWRIKGAMLMLDGGGSHDPDGQITSYDWYITTPQGEEVYTGQVAQHLLTQKVPITITLVVTDDRRGTNFVSVTVVPIDVHPGSDVNPINPKVKGVLPVAILSSAMFDASTIDPDSLRLGPAQGTPAKNGVHREDVNNDGVIDLMLQFPIQQLGIESGTARLCMTGKLPNGTMFESCDEVKVK